MKYFSLSQRILLIVVFVFIAMNAKAQKKGIFNETITFNSEPRLLSFYVPNNYDTSQKYQLMVALHGLGDNSKNFRDALVNSLNWKTYFPNTIIVCPDGGSDQAKDFYLPPGDEGIIQKAMQLAVDSYNIDTTRIILEGFSLGGRSALKYGLDHPGKFFGLLLNTPAVQGVADARNDSFAGVIYNYKNASKVPIFITNGGSDFIYLSPIQVAFEELVKNDGLVARTTIPGLGHQIPNFTYLGGVINFFENPALASEDAEVVKADIPKRVCDTKVDAQILVRNTGGKDISNIDLSYTINGNTQTYKWSGMLKSYQHALINIPSMMVSEGEQSLKVEVKNINGKADTVTFNNDAYDTVMVQTVPQKLPISEGFENGFPENGWINYDELGVAPWELDDQVHSSGMNSLFTFNTILLFYNIGWKEEFASPVLDLTSTNDPTLYFDVAYNFNRYTPPYFLDTFDFADTLVVSISADCGKTFEELYKNGGEDLATFDKPVINPLSITAGFINPSKDNWRKEAIDLSAYKSYTDVIIKFSYVSAQGGAINIDNIEFRTVSSIAENNKKPTFTLYPNPASDHFTLQFPEPEPKTINFYNASGKQVFTQKTNGNHQFTIPTSNFKDGIYFIEVIGNRGIEVRKVIVE